MSAETIVRPLLTTAEVAELLQLRNPKAVYYLARPGGPLAPARVQIGGHIRFNRAALNSLLAADGMPSTA